MHSKPQHIKFKKSITVLSQMESKARMQLISY